MRKNAGKTIHGVAVTPYAFKSAIIEAVRAQGRAKPKDIVPYLGAEWAGKGQSIAHTMKNMVHTKRQFLALDDEGYYILIPNYDVRHKRDLEIDLPNTVRDLGGLARMCEILGVYGVRGRGFRRTYGYDVRIDSVRTEIIRLVQRHLHRYYKDGVWGPQIPELIRAPVIGRWMKHLLVYGWPDHAPATFQMRGHEWRAFAAAHQHFIDIGDRATELRLDAKMTERDVAEDAGFKAAIETIIARLPSTSEIYYKLSDQAYLKAKREGRENDTQYVAKLNMLERRDLPAMIIINFEWGASQIHSAATLQFYEAYERLFGVSARELTWGNIKFGNVDAHYTDKDLARDIIAGIGLHHDFYNPDAQNPHHIDYSSTVRVQDLKHMAFPLEEH